MLERLVPGSRIDDFVVVEQLNSGAMGYLLIVTREGESTRYVMKVPKVGPGESEEGLISHETETMVLPALSGPHVPRVIAVGDISRIPFLVIEFIEGKTLSSLMGSPVSAAEAATFGAAIADALQSIHDQGAIHLDIKPDNLIFRADGSAVLIDFGLAHHARYPDLLAEEMRYAAGSAPYVSPEQVRGVRSDTRSDLFALGVILYEMVTGELPFGVPATMAGLRDRLWMAPAPPSALAIDLPPWLQEVILRCLEPRAEDRYQSASHAAFDLRNPEQIVLTARATRKDRPGVLRQARNWWAARAAVPRDVARRDQASDAAVVMVAVDTMHPEDERQPEIKRVTARVLSLSKEFRLICVSVIRADPVGEGAGEAGGGSGTHLEHIVRLRNWAESLGLPPRRLSLHVLEAASSAETLLTFARANHVNLIILGAPGPRQHALAWWRSVASSVTANAHCSVHVVRVPRPEA